jgi:hypothetical protein
VCHIVIASGAADVTFVSNVTFKGLTVLRRNSWGALCVASPVTVTFEGGVVVADNTRDVYERATWADNRT